MKLRSAPISARLLAFTASAADRLVSAPARAVLDLANPGQKLATKSCRAACALFATLAAVTVAEAQMTLGSNVNFPGNASTVHMFINVFDQMANWRTQNVTNPIDYNTMQIDSATRDANGWVTTVPFTPDGGVPQYVHTVIGSKYPAGTYRFTWAGKGAFTLAPTPSSAGNTISITNADSPGTRTITLTAPAGFNLKITATSPGTTGNDYLQDFRIIPSDYITAYDSGKRIRTDFVDNRRANGGVFRFLDLMEINNSPIVEWADRTPSTFYSQAAAENGLAYESIVEFANAAGVEPWVQIPAKASDDYVRQFARFLRDNLNPHTRIWVEFSNETWNSQFSQYRYCIDRAKAELGFVPVIDANGNSNEWRGSSYYTVYRSGRIWQIFNEEFGAAQHRIIKVLATQSGTSGVTNARIGALGNSVYNPTGIRPDYLAGAPYFGSTVTTTLKNAGILDTATVSQILDYVDDAMRNIHGLARAAIDVPLANAAGLSYVTYEGGQSLLLKGAPDASKASLNERYISVNRDNRMYDIYRTYLDGLRNLGVEMYVNYYDVEGWGTSGYWGAREYEGQSVDKNVPGYAAKAAALIDWSAANAPLLVEKFADGDYAGWSTGGSTAPAFSVVNGRLIQGNAALNAWAFWNSTTAKSNWADVHYSFDYTPANANAAGAFFRALGYYNGYRLTITGSNAKLEKVVNGTVTAIAPTATVGHVAGQTAHVDIYARGSNITVYLNGTNLFGTVADTQFAKGSVGTFVSNNAGTAFDEVYVWPQ